MAANHLVYQSQLEKNKICERAYSRRDDIFRALKVRMQAPGNLKFTKPGQR